MIGQPTPLRSASTACAAPIIVPGPTRSSAGRGVEVGQFALLDRRSGQRVAAADEPDALQHLAQQLAFFDGQDTAAALQGHSAGVDAAICESLREVLRQWCAAEADYDPHATLLAGPHRHWCQPRHR